MLRYPTAYCRASVVRICYPWLTFWINPCTKIYSECSTDVR